MVKDVNLKKEEEALLLNKELVKIADKFMEAYKEDVNIDIDLLLDENKLSNDFIWVVRKTGTHLYEEDKLFILDDGSRDDYLYFKDYEVLVYRITVSKRGRKNVYGKLEKLNRKKLNDKVENNGKSFKNVHFKVLMKDDTINEIDMPCESATIYSLATELKVNVDDIKKVYRQKYFN